MTKPATNRANATVRARATFHATAPVRVDLAGGTLDLWPLGMLHPGAVTVAVAIDLFVEATASRAPRGGGWLLRAEDLGVEERVPGRGRKLGYLRLLAEAAGPAEGATLVTRSPVAAGSGLGTSSALGVAAAAALRRLAGGTPRRPETVALVRDLEARVLGIPTGTQDHEAAWAGGLVALEQRAGGAVLTPLPNALLAGLRERLIVVDSRAPRSSGPSNWDMFKRRIDGDRAAIAALRHVARAGARAAAALAAPDWRALGRAMREDLDARRGWSELVVTPHLDALFAAAAAEGALGWKVCGAGGGGYLAVLAAPERRERVAAALAGAGGWPAAAGPTARGLRVSRRP